MYEVTGIALLHFGTRRPIPSLQSPVKSSPDPEAVMIPGGFIDSFLSSSAMRRRSHDAVPLDGISLLGLAPYPVASSPERPGFVPLHL